MQALGNKGVKENKVLYKKYLEFIGIIDKNQTTTARTNQILKECVHYTYNEGVSH